MKKFSADEPLNLSQAQKCFVLNQLATPGLGSLMAQRFVSGSGQLVLALVGFVLLMGWFILTMIEAYGVMDSNGPAKSYASLGISGGAVFAAAWIWSLVTSISLLRHATRNSPPPPAPPRLS